jgi:methionine-rich copper-binding protein CopC
VVFTTSTGPDTTPPTVTARSPANGASGVSVSTQVTATFSEALDAGTVNATTVQLRDAASNLLSATVSYNATTRTATLVPAAVLLPSSTYTVTLRGAPGEPSIKDVAGNALAANVTWTFTTVEADTTPPTVTARSPASGATGVSVSASVTATFSEALDAATINTATFELRDASSNVVVAGVGYDAATRTATLTPSTPLAPGAIYTASLRGGPGEPSIKDAAGNALFGTTLWTFTTRNPGACPCSVFDPAAVPSVPASSDTGAVELGMKFTTSQAGFVTGVRFYKGVGNSGTHVGNLWSASGTLLASVTFTGETASGWQEANFANPVPVAANTTYVVSYHAPNGRYAIDVNYFTGTGVERGPLRAPQSAAAGGNGVYRYGATSGFPSQSWNGSNYWVDVVFTP